MAEVLGEWHQPVVSMSGLSFHSIPHPAESGHQSGYRCCQTGITKNIANAAMKLPFVCSVSNHGANPLTNMLTTRILASYVIG
jgi:hypothetical protein